MSLLKKSWYILFSFIAFCTSSEDDSKEISVQPSDVLYFNRVAKTGTTSLVKLIQILSKRLHYKGVGTVDSIIYDSLEGQLEEINSLLSLNQPTVWVRHYAFLDFESFGYKWKPEWMSIVRNPIERVISWYSFVRSGWFIVSNYNQNPEAPVLDINFLKMSLDECVKTRNSQCNFYQDKNIFGYNFPGHFSQILHFCGHLPICQKFNNKEAFMIAKSNVEKYYSVVGITENMQETLTVMEAKLPRFFDGAYDTYFNDELISQNKNVNHLKTKISEETRNILNTNFTYEVQFYEFCKERLQKQLKGLSY